MTKFKKIIGIIFMVLFFTKASSEYKTIFYDYKLNDIDYVKIKKNFHLKLFLLMMVCHLIFKIFLISLVIFFEVGLVSDE